MRLDPAFAARAETSTRAADTPRPRPCVLVVDDEPQITRSVAELLAPDYEVVTAGSADEALALLAQRSFHVILSDQRMPRGNGSVLLARSLHVAPETTRILFTGYSDISAVIDAVNEGQVYHYLAKPWRPEELRAVVEQGVERYRLVTENRRLLDELQIANRELEAANRELNEFVAWVAHDLRSPLRALDGFSLILSDDFGDDLDDTAKQHLARIRAASRRLDELFDAQITLAEAGRRPIALEAVDVTAAARRVADELQRGEPGRVVDVVIADDLQATTDPELARPRSAAPHRQRLEVHFADGTGADRGRRAAGRSRSGLLRARQRRRVRRRLRRQAVRPLRAPPHARRVRRHRHRPDDRPARARSSGRPLLGRGRDRTRGRRSSSRSSGKAGVNSTWS